MKEENKNNQLLSVKQRLLKVAHPCFWFVIGFAFSFVFLGSFLLLYLQYSYKNKVIPGVFIDRMYVGEKKQEEIEKIFNNKNELIKKSTLEFATEDTVATFSAKDLDIGYNSKLIAEQAIGLGKSSNILSNLYIVVHSYLNGIFLSSSKTFNPDKLESLLAPIQSDIYIEPVDALFTVENNRVVAFKQSSDGKTVDFASLIDTIEKKIPVILSIQKPTSLSFQVPIKTLTPAVSTEKANNFGIVEVIGEGKSYYAHSIPNRIYNVSLAASKINGVLVAPGEEFSFVKYLGDVSKYTGYKEAYVIQGGRTVLGDGGGVCQVSTTLFRAILNSGLPVTERHAHSYRVGYYEQSSPAGIDATVFYPSIDLKFKNDTDTHILIQSFVDSENLALTFVLYGKKDNRQVSLTTPVITSQTPPPAPLYQDDPTLPKGQQKQVDFEAWGANVSFRRTVSKNGNVVINETFASRYSPWQAVFLKGTKE